MRAVVLDAVRAQPEVREVAEPAAPAGGVVVRVLATGMCRSDWHAWAGHDDDHLPARARARARRRGGRGRRRASRRWRVGDRVTVPFVCGCGRCEWCRAGRRPGLSRPAAARLHPLGFVRRVRRAARGRHQPGAPSPTHVDFATAAGLGCRFATAYRALVGRARISRGRVGDGRRRRRRRAQRGDDRPRARRPGSSRSTATRGPGRGRRARRRPHAAGRRHRRPGRRRTSSPAAAATSRSTPSAASRRAPTPMLSLRRRGRHVQVGLLPPVDGHPRVPMDRVIGWELDVLGSHGMAAVDYPAMMALIEDGVAAAPAAGRTHHRAGRGGGAAAASTGRRWPA